MKHNRRKFIKQLALGGVALSTMPHILSGTNVSAVEEAMLNEKKGITLALIGAGGMGTGDTFTALSVEGVKLIAVCDLYDARIEKAKSNFGKDIFTTKDYNEILALPNLDAVIIGTPDHWHQPIAIAALKAGKHVYCEKPVIHKVREGEDLIKAEKNSNNLVFLTGSQGMSSIGNRIARHLIQAGVLGKINNIDGQFSAAPGDPNWYPIPEDATEKSIAWNQFLGNAPKIGFEPQKFFYWRNWKEYGTGIAGDLFVHVVASVHYIMDTIGPRKIYTTGGIRHYTTGNQNVPDVMLAYVDYPDKNGLGEFTLSLGANYVDGLSNKWGSTDFKIIGEKGTMDVQWDKVIVKTMRDTEISTFSSLDDIKHLISEPQKTSPKEYIIKGKEGDKGGHYNHFNNFFTCIREKKRPIGDSLFGVQTAAVALLSYDSYEKDAPIYWDAEKLKIIKK